MEGYKVEGIKVNTTQLLEAMTGGRWEVCTFDDFMAAMDAANMQDASRCACA